MQSTHKLSRTTAHVHVFRKNNRQAKDEREEGTIFFLINSPYNLSQSTKDWRNYPSWYFSLPSRCLLSIHTSLGLSANLLFISASCHLWSWRNLFILSSIHIKLSMVTETILEAFIWQFRAASMPIEYSLAPNVRPSLALHFKPWAIFI